MGLEMRDARILGILFSLTGHVQQDIETRKIRVPVDDRLRLLFLHLYQLMYGDEEFLQEPALFLTRRDLRKVCIIVASFLSHTSIWHSRRHPINCPSSKQLAGQCEILSMRSALPANPVAQRGDVVRGETVAPGHPRSNARLAARRAFSRALAFCCFSYATTSWQASQRFRMRDFVVKTAPQRRHDFVIVSSNGRMPGFWGSR
jgi:hypothetical protein